MTVNLSRVEMASQHGETAVATTTTTTTTTAPTTAATSWTETAHEWLQRSRRKRAIAQVPHDPASATWAFVRPSSSSLSSCGTGSNIAFVDAVLRRQQLSSEQQQQQLPVIDVRGDCCKTWTVVSLAARFVVATRPSQFKQQQQQQAAAALEQQQANSSSCIPQVFILDSTHDVTPSKLAYTVRSNLLRHSTAGGSSTSCSDNPGDFERETESCLARIHVATADDISGWVSLLEALRSKLVAPISSEHATLILWDGFLSEPHDEASRMEVIRQLSRLVQECSSSVLLMTTSVGNRKHHEWEKLVTHRIKLERNHSAVVDGHEFMATVQGSRIPFSVSLAGILS